MSYYREFYPDQGEVEQGTWIWFNEIGQTNFASVRNQLPGFWYNSTSPSVVGDEYKWSNIFLPKGNYKLTMIYRKKETMGIADLLFGTKLLGKQDMYVSTITENNQVKEITFSLNKDQTNDLRFKVSGKNASASHYYISFSRLVLESVA